MKADKIKNLFDWLKPIEKNEQFKGGNLVKDKQKEKGETKNQ